MRKQLIRKWSFRIAATSGLVFILLLVIVLNPTLLYAKKTSIGNHTVYHMKPLDKSFERRLNDAIILVKRSEIYNPSLSIDICLNDGSAYPAIVQSFQSPAFGLGFYNKVVIMGKINSDENTVELNGYKWNLTQLLAHEAIHCFQYDKLGIWESKPFKKYPSWKWEGYNEYIARQNPDQLDLRKSIAHLLDAEKQGPGEWGISFADNTVAARNYYRWWLLVKYCLDIKGITYSDLLKGNAEEAATWKEMMDWYAVIPAQQ